MIAEGSRGCVPWEARQKPWEASLVPPWERLNPSWAVFLSYLVLQLDSQMARLVMASASQPGAGFRSSWPDF